MPIGQEKVRNNGQRIFVMQQSLVYKIFQDTQGQVQETRGGEGWAVGPQEILRYLQTIHVKHLTCIETVYD